MGICVVEHITRFSSCKILRAFILKILLFMLLLEVFFYFSSPIETKENQLFYSVLIVGTIYLFMNILFYFSAPGSLH